MSNPRHLVLRTVAGRQPRSFARPTDADGHPLPVRDFFGSHTFGIAEMREHLPAETVRQFVDCTEHGKKLTPELADRIAQATLEWALERGVTHFCHWFQPMTGSTAEKHDAFLSFDDERPISRFTGSQLIQSEPDASSFPSGGIRTTFEARGYTAWDPTSPMFIMDRTNGATLCIPSAFFSYHGDALDKKTPLLRSMEAIHEQSLRLLHLIGDDGARRVVPTAGPEQEYFLVDRALVAFRPDLKVAGRTVLGAPPPKGQSLDDHYFGAIPSRVLAFMHELETELYKVGVPAQTRHNEVAPSQFELAVLYREANVAADHNQLVLELVEKVAGRHNFYALLHEKPFAGVNGSGKHLNWSLQDDRGHNLLDPSDDPGSNTRFQAFLAAVLHGVHRYGGLLRASIASHGNDFRLGANEAPPAIISVFLGEQLTALVDSLVAGEQLASGDKANIELGVQRMPPISRDNTDRNRTSPFAFTGNKFEFRAVGSGMSISFPCTCVNTVVAAGIAELADRIEAKGGDEKAVREAIREILDETSAVRFEGDNYSDEWVREAERRGLPNLRKTPEAVEMYRSEEVQQLFSKLNILSETELASRHAIAVERYNIAIEIEANVLAQMVDQSVLPAALAERRDIAEGLAALKQLGQESPDDLHHLQALGKGIEALRKARRDLAAVREEAEAMAETERAHFNARNLAPALEAVREAADALETQISDERWTLPRYHEMLFTI